MSGEISRLYATIGADTREFQAGLSAARTSLVQFGGELNTYRQRLNGLAETLNGATKGDVARASIGQLNQLLNSGKISVQQYDAAVRQIQQAHGLASASSQQAAAQLTALTNAYAKGDITTKQYTDAVNKLSTSIEETGSKQQTLGGIVSSVASNYMNFRFIVGDVVRAFGEFVGSGAELETVMSRIEGLTGTSGSAIKGLTADVIQLSTELPKTSKDLVEGLYFVASSGFAGQQAMDILTVSAKASAAGLGETKVVADAVTSTLNAYKMGAGDAAKVTDVLIQSVKEGKGEPAALAGALGRVLPIAAAAGVSFEQVAASLATMTRTGLSAEEAATALRGTIGALEAPGKQAQGALESIGTSADEVRAAIRDKGLLAALQDLMQRTGGNVEMLDLIIPNIRALTGVLSTAGSQGEAYAEILGKMENASGSLDKAYSAAAGTLEFQTKRFENSANALKDTFVMGVLPALTDAAVLMNGLIGPTKNAAAALDEFQKKGDTTTAAILILTRGNEMLKDTFIAHQAAMRQQLASGKISLEQYNTEIERSARVVGLWRNSADGLTGVNKLVDDSVQILTASGRALAEAQYDAATSDEALAAQIKMAGDAAKNAAPQLSGLGEAAGTSKDDIKALKDEVEYWMGLVDGPVGSANKSYIDDLSQLNDKAADLRSQLSDLEAAQGKMVTTQKKGTLSANELQQAQLKLAAAQTKLAAETDPLKQANLRVEIDKLTGKINGATGAVTGYIDNSKKIGELQNEYRTVQGAIADLTIEHDKDIKKIILNILAARVANGDFGTEGTTILANLGEKWGLFDKATATAMRGVDAAAQALKNGGSLQDVAGLLDNVASAALGIPTDIEMAINVNYQAHGLPLPGPAPENGNNNGSYIPPGYTPPTGGGGGGSGGGGGGGGGGTCFVAGTRITLADGTVKPIEDVECGDEVLSINAAGNYVPGLVTELHWHEVDGHFVVGLDGPIVLKVTGEHPVYAPRLTRDVERVHGNFVRVRDLLPGDIVETQHGPRQVRYCFEQVDLVTVYNFNVERTHTYLANDVVVHNIKMAQGGSFVVPLGFENDKFPVMASSGERVTVSRPAQQTDSVVIHIAPNAFVFYEVMQPSETARAVSVTLGELADRRRRVN